MLDGRTIDGLGFRRRYVQDNGEDSYVVPFPTTRPAHIVFHGEQPFNHGHYGYHLGIEDRLTFLGASSARITGHFMDCRSGSETRGRRFSETFAPSSHRTLVIPPGVAHCFDGLAGVHTINSYRMYLPDPKKLLTAENPWSTGADITNFAIDVDDADVPYAEPNPHPASETFYDILREFQLKTLKDVTHEYPSTETVALDDGSRATIQVSRRVERRSEAPDWEPVDAVAGVGWRRHHIVWGDQVAGYAALLDPSPFQVIDHGETTYANDAYGIHLQSEDRLTFLGPPDKVVYVRFLDCRRGSPTFDNEVEVAFHPSPHRFLVIPPGVAHGFRCIENVFTVNRPRRAAGDLSTFEPGNDVIDWHFDERPTPAFDIDPVEVPLAYYKELARRQARFIAQDDAGSTAMVFLANDDAGRRVRVALRKA